MKPDMKWLVALILLFAAPARAEVILVWIDPALESYSGQIKRGLEVWSRVADVKFYRVHPTDRHRAHLFIYRKDGMAAWGEQFYGYIYLNTKSVDLATTTAHEFGHVPWGPNLRDTYTPGDLMYYRYSPGMRLSPSEKARAIQVFGKAKR